MAYTAPTDEVRTLTAVSKELQDLRATSLDLAERATSEEVRQFYRGSAEAFRRARHLLLVQAQHRGYDSISKWNKFIDAVKEEKTKR